jgi:radical SAM/Cys-rich protein
METAVSHSEFGAALDRVGHWPLCRGAVTTLQVNVGKVCNQACHHCHVEAGPARTESMTARTAERVLELLASSPDVGVLDITGGAPELNANFRQMVVSARGLGRHVIDRCNLTVLFEPGQEETADFLARNGVEIVASLPCYQSENVDRQRGLGVFDRSVEALRRLNALGYGREGSGLTLNLVFNPGGPSLPPEQASLEASYKTELFERFGIQFNRLLTLTNMPIRRFAQDLERTGKTEAYMSLLVNHFNPDTIPGLMCTSLLSVGYDGRIYDCDFNQMLEMPLAEGPETLWELQGLEELVGRPVATGAHCFGCTAGTGSSCGGALT